MVTLLDLLEHWDDRNLEAPLLTYCDGDVETSLSRAEFRERAEAIAAHLSGVGAPGDRALLVFPPGLDFLCAFMGAICAGVTAVPVYPPDSRAENLSRFRALLEDAEPSVLLTSEHIGERLAESGLTVLPRIAADAVPAGDATLYRRPRVEADAIAYIQYTSGSTRTPLGVVHAHANILSNMELIRRAASIEPTARHVLWLPLYHDMGLISSLTTMAHGDRTILMSPLRFMRRPIEWLRTISRFGATHGGGPNFGYDHCVRRVREADYDTLDLSSWAQAYTGAEPVRVDTLDRFTDAFERCGFRREAFLPCYGLAEATLMVSMGPSRSKPAIVSTEAAALARGRLRRVDPRGRAQELVGSGSIHPEAEVAIVDPKTLRRARPDEVGEIWVRGPGIGVGYWRKDDETERVFKARTEPDGDGPFLRTGDLGFIAGEQLFVAGRIKDLIVIRGRNYYPQDIESVAANAHRALRSHCCIAVGLSGREGEELGVFFEVPQGGAPGDPGEVIRAVREAISEAFALSPIVIGVVEHRALPRTSSGKVRRAECRQQFLEQRLPLLAVEGEMPCGEVHAEAASAPAPGEDGPAAEAVERRLLEEVGRVVGRPVGGDEVITRLGITSVDAIDIMFEIEEEFGLPIEPEHLSESIRISELARRVAAGTPAAQSLAVSDPEAPSARPASDGPLDVSLMYFSTDTLESPARFDLLLRSARFADEHGFRALWIPERHFHPFGGAYPNPSVAAAALAVVTNRIRLRAGSVVLPLHNPIRVAEEWAFVDNLSRGRVDLSFATGWNPDDFALAPDAFVRRRRLTLESIEEIHRLWAGQSTSATNGKGEAISVSIFPRPVQPRLETWLTCTRSVEGFVEAGGLGYNVLTALLFQRVEELAEKILAYRSARERHGHDPEGGRVTLMLHTFVGESEDQVHELVKPAFKRYLASSADLWKGEWPELVQQGEIANDRLLELGYQRYIRGNALIGTPGACAELAAHLQDIGVDELACLIDFGVDPEATLGALSGLDRVRLACERRRGGSGAAQPGEFGPVDLPSSSLP